MICAGDAGGNLPLVRVNGPASRPNRVPELLPGLGDKVCACVVGGFSETDAPESYAPVTLSRPSMPALKCPGTLQITW